MRTILFTVLGCILFCNTCFCQVSKTGFEFLKNILVVELANDSGKIDSFQKKYINLLDKIKKEFPANSVYDKHEEIFNILHSEIFKQYKRNIQLSKLFSNNIFNCATAVILYYAICIDLGLDIIVNETYAHIYISFLDKNKEIVGVELTNPTDGFDFDDDKEDYTENLLEQKIITQEELNEKGFEEIYEEYISDSRQIDSTRLLSIIFMNYAYYSIDDKKTDEAWNYARKALEFNHDSSTVADMNYVWTRVAEMIKTDNNKLFTFLNEILDIKQTSEELEDNVVHYSGYLLDCLVKEGKYTEADSLFNKLMGYLKFTDKKSNKIFNLELVLRANMIDYYTTRGEQKAAYLVAREYYKRNKNINTTQDLYIKATVIYILKLSQNNSIEEIKQIADTIYSELPEIKSVEDLYVSVYLIYFFNQEQDEIDIKKAKKYFFNMYKKIPSNDYVKQGITKVFRESAMKLIREKKYEDAIKTLEDGLQYDPNNIELRNEIKMTKDLL